MNELPDFSVSVIVPVHVANKRARRCLASLARVRPAPLETIVVADNDREAVKALAAETGTRVEFTRQQGGPARARNKGARAARGSILMFVDADVLAPADAIAQVEEAFRRQPGLTACFGSYDDDPACHNFLSQYRNLLHHYVHQTAREEAATFWSGCGAIRRDVFLDVGGFSKKYRRPTMEDIELGYRLKKAGHMIRLCKTLQVKHLKRWRLAGMLRTDLFDRAIPWTELILRERNLINDLNLRTSSRASVSLAYGAVLALAAGLVWPFPLAAGVAAVSAAGLVAMNADLYRYFIRKRGWRFTVLAVPMHFFYYLYCGLGFAIGTARYLARRLWRPQTPTSLLPLSMSRASRGTRNP
jgi:GT2 family glycosyltransferase